MVTSGREKVRTLARTSNQVSVCQFLKCGSLVWIDISSVYRKYGSFFQVWIMSVDRLLKCGSFFKCARCTMRMRHIPYAFAILHSHAPYSIRMRHIPLACAIFHSHAPHSIRMRHTTCACATLHTHTPYYLRMHHTP